MLFNKIYKVNSEKREIIKIEQKEKSDIYKVNFIYETTYYIFGKIKKKVIVERDHINFNSYEDAKDYLENVEKKSEVDLLSIIIFPLNYKIISDITIRYRYNVNKEKYLYYAFNSFNELIYVSHTLKDFVKETKLRLEKKETKLSSFENTKVGLYEIKELEEKRNDLIDNEIKRTEKYIEFLKTLKK